MKTLKYLIVLSILILSSELIKAQNYNPIINYSFNDTPVHGVKIKTNIPFINQQGMPTIIIEGYNYFDGKPIGLIFNWYIYENEFINNSISSFGAYTPEVKLSNENGKVVIFINEKKYFNRFTVRGFAHGLSEDISWFSNWSIADEPLSDTKTVTIPYKNTVGELNFPTGIVTNNGNVGIGTTTPENTESWNKVLEVKGTANSKLITTTSDITTGMWSHNTDIFSAPAGGLAGTHTNHPYSLITNKTSRMTIAADGNIGIGTTTPSEKLEVNGSVYSNTDNSYIGVDAQGESRLGLVKKGGFGPVISSGSNHPIILGSWNTPDIRNNISSGNFKEHLRINTNGNASLQGKLEAKEIKVTTTPTADFVFEDTYQLPDLASVEKHIKEKKHLPEIASAAEMQKEGVNIGDFQIKLLQKIEELTLYSIEQNKQNKEQQERILKLEEQIKVLLHN
ncbi:hypothetical protein [Elizabethkingia miricola]|uniref:Peptidase S74 domain-containing protein n=1 Tax=Elizabethkingia miricola TaxID=172045 RepID=A0ABD5B2U2_ELIMR|nr:hypothetical protein [Elizabethkingia miricola]MDQ8748163.1 hypothetical protein [Elizabethkingia miricola]UIO97436.1 hypothetical protein LYZ41_04950 [Elizabethkingia miricola]WNG66117.1 hypothetical protein M9H57_04910 [Elizabethkingia miricola]